MLEKRRILREQREKDLEDLREEREQKRLEKKKKREEARAAKDFAKSDAIRDDLIAKGVEVMDGDPLGWDWKLDI